MQQFINYLFGTIFFVLAFSAILFFLVEYSDCKELKKKREYSTIENAIYSLLFFSIISIILWMIIIGTNLLMK